MIKVENVTKNFGKLRALNKVNLQLETGNCIALIGPNGCGKTTLIKSILGMVLTKEGAVFFNGKNIKNDNLYRTHIGYMPQIGRYPENMTIGQVINLVKGIRNGSEPIDNELYEQFKIGTMLDKKMRTLSGGTIQKVSATLAFMFNPKVLILDEPTAGLDPVAAEILKEKILSARQSNKLILITSHLLSELEDVINRVIFMQDGSVLLHNSVDELKKLTAQQSVAKAIIHLLKNRI